MSRCTTDARCKFNLARKKQRLVVSQCNHKVPTNTTQHSTFNIQQFFENNTNKHPEQQQSANQYARTQQYLGTVQACKQQKQQISRHSTPYTPRMASIVMCSCCPMLEKRTEKCQYIGDKFEVRRKLLTLCGAPHACLNVPVSFLSSSAWSR